ncbi:hypothetical protein PSK37_25980 [Escherichia coli]|nr:hypothetical protein [Escherichia coli]
MTFSGHFNARQVKNKVCGLLAEMGLSLNQRKSSLIAACKRQQVTGIVVNHKPQLAREARRALRQEVHLCQKLASFRILVVVVNLILHAISMHRQRRIFMLCREE